MSDAAPQPVVVEDATDPRLAPFADVGRPDALRDRGRFVAESRHVVRALLASRQFALEALWCTEEAWSELASAVVDSGQQPEVTLSPRGLFEEVTGFALHRGCLGIGVRPPERDLAALPEAARFVLALEGIADPDNLGSLFRAARGFGVDAVVLAPGGADPLYRKTLRVSTGAALQVPMVRATAWPDGLATLRARGFTVMAAVTDAGATDVETFGAERPVPERVCVLLGSEAAGLTRAARARADVAITIRTAEGFDSLNVAMAGGILLHRFAAAVRS